jgi:hypothetical protein
MTVEAELGLQMRGGIVFVGNLGTELGSKLGINQGHGAIHRARVPQVVGGIVSQRSQRERVIVQILRLPSVIEKSQHKIAATRVMH